MARGRSSVNGGGGGGKGKAGTTRAKEPKPLEPEPEPKARSKAPAAGSKASGKAKSAVVPAAAAPKTAAPAKDVPVITDISRGRKRAASVSSDKVEAAKKKPRLTLADFRTDVECRDPADAARPCSVFSLGQGDTGQLGLGDGVLERKFPALVSALDDAEGDDSPSRVAAGGMHTLTLTRSGKVLSFGCNDEGALGRLTEEDEECYEPGEVAFPDGVGRIMQITAGDSHSAAVDEHGKVYYWGTFRDSSGSFGLTSDGHVQKLPLPLAHHLQVVKVSSGTDHIALLTEDGELYTVGCAEQGQLGRVGERFTSRGGRRGLDLLLKPDKVRAPRRRTTFTNVWAGSYCTLALTSDGEILACGLNNYSQLGVSGKKGGIVFHTLIRSSGFTDTGAKNGGWKNIVFGQHHALGLDGQGTVHSIGRVEYGRLGLGGPETDGGKEDAKVPVAVPKLSAKKCVDISCGTAVSFAVTKDGECFGWGMCTNDQLGHGEDDDAWEPALMKGKQLESRHVVAISGGGQHTVLLAKATK